MSEVGAIAPRWWWVIAPTSGAGRAGSLEEGGRRRKSDAFRLQPDSPDGLEAVRAFKLVTHTELDAIALGVRRLMPALSGRDAVDLIAAATSLSGAFWQMATPGPEIAALYRSDPRLSHAVVDVEARVERMLTALIQGLLAPT